MNDPQSRSHATGCGCSGKAAAEAVVAPSSCCSDPQVTAQQTSRTSGCCSDGKAADSAGTVTDPVCGMTVDPAKTAHHAEHAGRTYHFCSAGCRTKFVANPDAYLGDKPKPEPTATPGAMNSTLLPRLENSAILSLESEAETAITSAYDAG